MAEINKNNISSLLIGTGCGLALANIAVFRILFPKPSTKWKRKKYECAVVCGYPAAEDGKPSPEMKKRVEAAVEIWKKGKADVLIMSGGAAANRHVEAEVMAEYAKKLGVPEEKILLEKNSVSTYHNMMYVKQLMDEKKIKNCVVVTSGWHLRKANHYAQKMGMDYVMHRAEEIQGEKVTKTIWRYLSTNLHMFYKFYEGLY